MKKDGWADPDVDAPYKLEYIYDAGTTGLTGSSYGHVSVYSFNHVDVKSQIRIWIQSGSYAHGMFHDTGLGDITDGKWHHYTVTYGLSDTKNISKLYVDGIHKSTITSSAGGHEYNSSY